MQAKKMCPVGTEIQTLIFAHEAFKNEDYVKAWAREHDFKYGQVDETETSWRIRQQEPENFLRDSFRTITITDGISAVIACPKDKKEQGGLACGCEKKESGGVMNDTEKKKIEFIETRLAGAVGKGPIGDRVYMEIKFTGKSPEGYFFHITSHSDYPVTRATPKLARLGIKVERVGKKGERHILIPEPVFRRLTAQVMETGGTIKSEYEELISFTRLKDSGYFKQKYSDHRTQSSWLKPLQQYLMQIVEW